MSEHQVKKPFLPLIALMEANLEVAVSSIMEKVYELAGPKARGATGASASKVVIRDTDGNVVAIRCYYFKRFMPLIGELTVEFGSKANSATKLNSMCKEGVGCWTSQQRASKTAMSDLLLQVEKGEVKPKDIAAAREAIVAAKDNIVDTELGFATREECIDYLVDNEDTINQGSDIAVETPAAD